MAGFLEGPVWAAQKEYFLRQVGRIHRCHGNIAIFYYARKEEEIVFCLQLHTLFTKENKERQFTTKKSATALQSTCKYNTGHRTEKNEGQDKSPLCIVCFNTDCLKAALQW